jgi:hypothetical protein
MSRAHLFFAALLVLLVGCTAATIHDNTKTQYMNAVFTSEELTAGGLAMFPVTAGEGQEGYRRPLGDFLSDSLSSAVPGGKVLVWTETMDSLNARDKVHVYQDMVAAYAQTSIIDKQKVKELSEALHVRYGLFCALQKFSSESHTGYSVWTGWNTIHKAEVAAHCLVIDLRNGDVMQEIIGSATSLGGEYNYDSPYEAYAAIMARSVLSQLPGSAVTHPTKSEHKSGSKTLHSR